jgi:ferrous iron transport protein A
VSDSKLRDIPIGGLARVVDIKGTHRSYRAKLLSMGLTRGVTLFVQNVAPMGDPVHISVRDFDLSLRRDEADALVLEPVEGSPEDYGFRRLRGRGRGGNGRFGRKGRHGRRRLA